MTRAVPPRLAGHPAFLAIDGTVAEGRALLVARGQLVHGCTEILAEALTALPAGVERIELDMGDVEFMDPGGLRFLDLLGGYSHRETVPVTTANWRGQPLRVLELAGLDTADPLRTTAPRPPEAGAERLHVLEEEVDQLRRAIASRPVIDQARGVLMALHSCTSDEAWDILREASQLSNTKLRDVAGAVTAGTETEGPPPPPEIRSALRTALARLGH